MLQSENENMNIYVGNYHEVLQSYHLLKGVGHVISEERNVETEIVNFCKKENIQISLVQSGDHVNEVAKKLGQIDLCIVASFGLILKNPFIDRVKRIINIHPGSLYNSRGRHPLPFAIRLGLSSMTLTAHIIEDEKIDNGPIVMEMNMPIDYSVSYRDNDKRLRSCLPYITRYILESLDNRFNIPAIHADLTHSPYNKPIDKEELSELMNATTLDRYKK